MNIAVIGSREYPHLGLVAALVSRFGRTLTVVSGGASGVDLMAEVTAERAGLGTCVYKAHWRRPDGGLDRGAGFARNADIIHTADVVLAFWDRDSRGTRHAIALALGAGKPTLVIDQRFRLAYRHLSRLQREIVAQLPQQLRVGLFDTDGAALADRGLQLLPWHTLIDAQGQPLQGGPLFHEGSGGHRGDEGGPEAIEFDAQHLVGEGVVDEVVS